MIIRHFTITYKDSQGQVKDFRILAQTACKAMLSARELLPPTCEILRIFHDPEWMDL